MNISQSTPSNSTDVPTYTDKTYQDIVEDITSGDRVITRKEKVAPLNKTSNPKKNVLKTQKEKVKERNRKAQKTFRDKQRETDEANEKELDELMARTKYLIDRISYNWKEIADKKIMEKSVLIYGDDVIEPAMFIGNIDDAYWDVDIEDVWKDPFNMRK